MYGYNSIMVYAAAENAACAAAAVKPEFGQYVINARAGIPATGR